MIGCNIEAINAPVHASSNWLFLTHEFLGDWPCSIFEFHLLWPITVKQPIVQRFSPSGIFNLIFDLVVRIS